MIKIEKRFFLYSFFIVVFFLGGCDQINNLKNKFFPPDKKASSSAISPPEDSSSVPQNKNEIINTSSTVANALEPNVIARVGSWTLTVDEFKDRIKSLKDVIPDFDTKKLESKKMVLDELVRQELMVMDAEAKGLGNKKEILDAVNEFRRTLLVREGVNRLTEGVTVNDTEIQDYYNQNKTLFVEPAEYHLREIVLATQPGAKDVLVEILKGADFDETAKARSQSKTATSGGDLGWIKSQDLNPQMLTAVANLEVGDVSNVFKGPNGYSIVKLQEKKGGKQLNLADVKSDIKTGLTQLKQQQAVLNYLNSLEQKIPVKVNESLLKE